MKTFFILKAGTWFVRPPPPPTPSNSEWNEPKNKTNSNKGLVFWLARYSANNDIIGSYRLRNCGLRATICFLFFCLKPLRTPCFFLRSNEFCWVKMHYVHE